MPHIGIWIACFLFISTITLCEPAFFIQISCCACAKQQAQCNAVCPRKRDIADVTTKINSGRSCTAQVCNFNSGLTVTSIVVSISCLQGLLPVKVIVATANQNVLLFCCCPLCLFSLRKPKVFALQILQRYLTKEGRVRKFSTV